jgi:U3 small nucleolar ribonucleoprotein component
MMYSDFFPPPPRDRSKPPPRKPEAKPRDKKGKGKASVRFSEEDDVAGLQGDEAQNAEAGPSSSRDTMSRVRDDLFAGDDEAEEQAASANLSSHEKRMLALKEQISSLEQENIGPKDWTLLGEATSKARPENSLLEENLDFEHTGKVVPLVTEEKVLSLEEMIKKRILDVSPHRSRIRSVLTVAHRKTLMMLFEGERLTTRRSCRRDTLNCRMPNPHVHSLRSTRTNTKLPLLAKRPPTRETPS